MADQDPYLARLRQHLEIRHLSKHTIKPYLIRVGQFLRFLRKRRVASPAKVTRDHVQAFRDSLRGLTPSSRRQADAALKLFFAMLVDGGAMLANPMDGLKTPKERPKAQRPTLTPAEMDAVLNVPSKQTAVGVRNRAILEVLYSSAIRKQELLGLSVYDLDLNEGFLWIRKGKGRKDRKVPLGLAASRSLRHYLDFARPVLGKRQASQQLFLSSRGNDLHEKELAKMIHACAKNAGIKRPVTPHVFRHTAATEMIRNGAPLRYVQEMLGHRFLATTQIYTRVTNPDLRKMIDRYHPSSKSRARGPRWRDMAKLKGKRR